MSAPRRTTTLGDPALVAVRSSYERLSTTVLSAARTRGYLGIDADAAADALTRPSPEDERLRSAAADLWLAFFTAHPGALPEALREAVDSINHRLAQKVVGGIPEATLAVDLLEVLTALWEEGEDLLARRRDAALSAAAGSGNLPVAIAQACAAAQITVAAEEPPGVSLGRLLDHLRSQAADARRESRETTAAVGALIKGLMAVATGKPASGLPTEAERILEPVRQLDAARRAQEQELRELRTRLAGTEAELAAVKQRSALSLERPAAPEATVDARLKLYRQAFAVWAADGDPGELLRKVQELEQVLTLDKGSSDRLVRRLNRCHSDVVRALGELHGINPGLIDDPKRHRPKGFLGFGTRGDYDLKSVPGLVEALRDSARDLGTIADRACWADGVLRLTSHAPRVRAVFRELVKLVTHWKEKLGDPPPVSMSISLDGGSGILALPAVVATDVESLLKRRTKAAPAAAILAPVMEECVALYHTAVNDALGTPGQVPPRSAPAKRESQIQAATRLAGELAALAGIVEHTFSEAIRGDLSLAPQDRALLEDDRLLRSGLVAVDAACVDLRELHGAPPLVGNPSPSELPPVPTRRDPRALHLAVTARAAWLEELARYRFIVAP